MRLGLGGGRPEPVELPAALSWPGPGMAADTRSAHRCGGPSRSAFARESPYLSRAAAARDS
jgi:hypothetical protein